MLPTPLPPAPRPGAAISVSLCFFDPSSAPLFYLSSPPLFDNKEKQKQKMQRKSRGNGRSSLLVNIVFCLSTKRITRKKETERRPLLPSSSPPSHPCLCCSPSLSLSLSLTLSLLPLLLLIIVFILLFLLSLSLSLSVFLLLFLSLALCVSLLAVSPCLRCSPLLFPSYLLLHNLQGRTRTETTNKRTERKREGGIGHDSRGLVSGTVCHGAVLARPGGPAPPPGVGGVNGDWHWLWIYHTDPFGGPHNGHCR